MGDVPPSGVNPFRGPGEDKVSVSEPDATTSTTPGNSFNDCATGGRVTSSQTIDLLTSWLNAIGTTGFNRFERPAQIAHHPGSTRSSRSRQRGPPSSLNMSSMAYALPDHHPQSSPFETHHMAPQYPSAPHTPGLAYHMPAVGQFPGQNISGNAAFNLPFTPNYSHYALSQQGQHVGAPYPAFVANAPSVHGMGTGHAPVYGSGYYPQPPYATSYTTPFGNGPHPVAGQQRRGSFQARQSSRGPVADSAPSSKRDDRRASETEYDVSKTIVDGSNPMRLAQPSLTPGQLTSPSTNDGSPLSNQFCCHPDVPPLVSTAPSTPRGPPRKPKQSGHALWVGNLPPGANVMDLRDHFAQDATNDIESVFLISKSNCAFVNYKSAAACTAALARFHDSRFQSVRLVCRLRKGFTAPGAGLGVSRSQSCTEETLGRSEGDPSLSKGRTGAAREDGARSLDRYFIVKSLTVEDLELSKQSGIWATQTHNETNLNHAFEVSPP